jgi:capsular exopolysaccharide synthesis family protein
MEDSFPQLVGKGEDVIGSAANDDGARFELVTESGTDYPSESPIRWLRRVLRGRYRLAIGAAALAGCIGAVAGYFSLPPKYESRGLIRIEGTPPAILYPTFSSQTQYDFDAYIAAQEALLRSRHVLETAVDSTAMRKAGWKAGRAGIAALQQGLSVRRPRAQRFMHVSVTHADPELAHAAVNAVLQAYSQTSHDPGGLTAAGKEKALVLREKNLDEALQQVRMKILAASDQYGSDAIARIHTAKLDEMMAIDRQLDEVQADREWLLEFETVGPLPGARDADPLSGLRQQELALIAEIKNSKYREGHPVLRKLEHQLETVRTRIALSEQARRGGSLDGGGAVASPLVELDRRETGLRAEREAIRQEAEELGQLRVALTGLTEQENELKQRLVVTRQRLDEIRFEAGRDTADRISISTGDLPVVPVSDRRQGLAAAGLLMGMLGGVGLIILIGLADPRARYADELESMDLPAPVVAVLPDLNKADDATRHIAVRGIAQLRSILELASRDPAGKVHVVTSADHGEGRTDLAHALATSFAAAGRRTLVIDADFTDWRLSGELKLKDRPGLCEALGDGAADERVHATEQANLWAMPMGDVGAFSPRHLASESLDRMLEGLRNRFDAIVFDTPPVLAAAETSLVSAAADTAILVVARNQKRDLINAAASRLRQVGANLIGLAFNKAAKCDLTYGRSSVPAATRGLAAATPGADGADTGPIATINAEPSAGAAPPEQERKRAA